MKYMKYLLLLLTLVSLAGCKTTPALEQLDTPSNLLFEEILVWDEVDNATSYDVFINDTLYHSNDNYFVISEEGEYSVYIIAKASGFENSEASATLELSLIYANEINPFITLVDNTLHWDAIEDAISYNVFIDGVKHETTDHSYALETFPLTIQFGAFEVSIQAVYPIGTSNVSESVILSTLLILTYPRQFQYSLNSTDDVLLFDDIFLDVKYFSYENGELQNANDILTTVDGVRAIKSSVITANPTGVFTFHLIHGADKIPIEIMITDKTTPYIISSSIIETSGTNDIQLQYELFDGEIYSINGTSEDTVLYSIEGSVLTIEKEFILEKFDGSDEFALSYVINVGSDSVVGYLHFNMQPLENQ